jgi:hypothetical protein
MESKQTAVEWLYGVFELHAKGKREAPNWWDFERAIHMEKEQHGETWDAALIAVDRRGGVILRALPDFDDYWANKSKTPPGAHCEEA